MSAFALASFPVAVVLARKTVFRSGWTMASWEGVAVLPGERFVAGRIRRQLLHEVDGVAQYMWDGLRLYLHRDAAETYWYNLTGARPSLFIICDEEDYELTPVAVTADHAESTSAVEADRKVLAVPIPAEIQPRLEEFVMTHYKPEPLRKRRRENWSEEERQ